MTNITHTTHIRLIETWKELSAVYFNGLTGYDPYSIDKWFKQHMKFDLDIAYHNKLDTVIKDDKKATFQYSEISGKFTAIIIYENCHIGSETILPLPGV